MDKQHDIIIAGAGPVGLFLATELALQNLSVLILERDPSPTSPWKQMPVGMRGLNTIAIEAFHRRGLLSKFFNLSEREAQLANHSEGFKFGGHFAGIVMDGRKLDLGSERFKYKIPGPALHPGASTIEQIETILTQRAEELGVTILRGKGVTRIIEETETDITVEAGDNNESFPAKWLIGCDGGRSMIRHLAGFEFLGTEPKFTAYAIKGTLNHPEKLKPGFQPTKTGMYILSPGGGLWLVDFDYGAFDRESEITQTHLNEVLKRVTCVEGLELKEVELARAFTDRSKQATTYRKGRVLLAGDAAHIHPPLGAQGLNLGLGDAMNLGWKVAATVRQEAVSASKGTKVDMKLLDSYSTERIPIGQWVLEWGRAQVATIEPTPYGRAIQKLMREMIETRDGTNLMIDRVWGMNNRYSLGDGEAYAHRLVGSSAPDFELGDELRLGNKMEGGKGLLVDFKNDEEIKKLLAGGYEDRVDFVGMGAKDKRGLRALLVRPDGTVAWVTEEGAEPDIDSLKDALKQWFEF